MNKMMLATNIDYYAIKEEYSALVDKKKALDQTYWHLNEEMQLRKKGKEWKLKKLFKNRANFVIVSKKGK